MKKEAFISIENLLSSIKEDRVSIEKSIFVK